MAIISISGYAGSGKDTVGRIIQYLHCYNPENISVTEAIINDPSQLYWLDEQSGWEIKKWAGKLKEVASILTGIPIMEFEDQEFKKSYLGAEWDTYGIIRKNGKRQIDVQLTPHNPTGPWLTSKENIEVHNRMTVRDLLQKLGTEALRNGLHENTWVNALMADYVPVPQVGSGVTEENDYAYPNWIITDTRFPNELYAVKQKGGVAIQVIKKGNKAVNDHVSEISLDGAQFDYVIENDGTIEDLVDEVKNIFKKIKDVNA
jgi:hypothetical protein